MKRDRNIIFIACLALVLLATAAFAEIATTINYQGRLKDSGGPVNGTASMTFAIYNAESGGVALWTETQPGVTVTDGAFSVALGSVTTLTTLPFDEPYYLSVTVNGDAEMTPRAALQTVPYSARAAFADDADTLDEMEAAEIIDAASDEVRTPISSLPVTIDTPGSYYLTGDLNVVSTSSIGITVNASDVTIDLMGFSITGPGSGTGRGIYINGRKNVEVRNGTVKGFGSDGIYEYSTSSKGHRIINVRVKDNGGIGIYFYGYDGGHLIKDSSVIGNGAHGILIYNGSTVSGNVSMRNGGYGILGTDGCSITGNTIASNLYDGINVRLGAVISGNTVKDNGSNGISALHGAVVTGNSAYTNGLSGIYVGYASIVTGNSAVGNGQNGIYAGSGSTVKNNAAYSNDANGIDLQGNCLVDGNTTFANNQSGGGFTNINCGGLCEFGFNVQ